MMSLMRVENSPVPSCAVCAKQDGLERCKKCLSIFYCVDHQTADLEKHKPLCGRVCVVCQKPNDKIFQCTRCLVNFCSSACKNVKAFHQACPSTNEERSVRNPHSIVSFCRALRTREKRMKTTPSTSNLQSEGSSSSTSSDVPLLVREKIDETTSSTSNPQSTPKSRTSSSSSSSSSPLREECQDTINVWKRLDEVLKLKSAPDCSEWTNDDRRWKTVGNIFAAWVTLQQSKNAFKNVGKKLDLSGLELTHLPDCLGKLPFRELDLRSNKLKALPDWIYHPFWWGELLFNASTFNGNYSDKYAEFLVKCHTNFKIAHVHGPQKLQSITNCSLSPIVRIAQYMVVGRYVFPFIENKVWIPEDFNINLIKSELAEARTRIKIDRKKLDDEVCKKMKISHPLAEAFFTGNASGDQSISENDAKTRFVQSCPPGHITTRLSEDQFGNFF